MFAKIGCFGVAAAVAAVACSAETKTSAAVAVLAHDQAFAPMEAAGSGKSTETLVDCPEVFEAAFVGDFKIDGDMDKDVWKAAKPISGFESRNPRRPMEAKSELKLLYSESAIYIGGVFWQPMKTMHAEYDQHDMPVYNDDSLEAFFFVSGENRVDLYHWAFNPLGAYLDMRNDSKTYWTKGIKVKTRRFDDRWTLEVKIPYGGMKMDCPLAGDFFGARFCRRVNNPRSIGAVPYLRTLGNDQRANFGKLLFCEPKGGLTEKMKERARTYRAEKTAERLRNRLLDIKRSVVAQECALTFWGKRQHPALETARLGVAQMRTAFDAFLKKHGEALKAGRPVDEKESKAFFDLAAGFSKFVSDNVCLVWPTSPWQTGAASDLPPEKGWGLAPIAFNQAGNEREAVCLDFAGLLCGARCDLRIVPQTCEDKRKKQFVSADQFEVYEEPYILQEGEVITAPLVRKDGNIVTLTPGHATRVWIVFNSRGVAPGKYATTIALKPATDGSIARRSIPVEMNVWNFTLPETRDWPVKSFFWGPNNFLHDETQALRIMHDHHVTHGWTKSRLYQFGLKNHKTILHGPKGDTLGYDPELAKTANEEFFRTAKDLGMRFVFGWGTPKHPTWFRTMSDRLTGMGFKSEDFVFKSLIKDEFSKKNIPTMAGNRAAVLPDRIRNDWWFQAVYLSVPPPAGATIDDIEEAKLPEFYRMWTVIRGLTKDPARGPEVIRRLKAKGCSVWTYECARYMQVKDILTYYRFYPLEAYSLGLDGAAVWCSGTRDGDDGFDSTDGYDDGALWVGNDRRYVTTKRFEAFREGLEDVAYVDRLKNEVERVRAKGGNVANAEALLKEPQTLMANPSQDAVDAWRLAVGEAIDDLTRK